MQRYLLIFTAIFSLVFAFSKEAFSITSSCAAGEVNCHSEATPSYSLQDAIEIAGANNRNIKLKLFFKLTENFIIIKNQISFSHQEQKPEA